MRAFILLLAIGLVMTPSALAETNDYEPTHGCSGDDSDDPECHDHDTPGFGIIGLMAALGAVALLRRRS